MISNLNVFQYNMDPRSSSASNAPITGSQNTLTNYTTSLNTDNTIIRNITDGVLTITGGYIQNITDPTSTSTSGELQRAVSKNYVNTSTSNVSVPLNSVQRSSGSNFLGSNGLLYVGPQMG